MPGMNVVVMMSTYNGEKYIQEQLDSILNQQGVNVRLFIRDDGSTDSTKAILKKYEDECNNVKVAAGENTGVGNSFMWLLYHSINADYYAFADQDDVWKKDKLVKGIEQLEECDLGEPLLYVSNQLLADKNLNEKGLRYQKKPNMHIINILNSNPFSGCTMIMNKQLRNILTDIKNRPKEAFFKVRIHDAWVAMSACCFGKIIYDEKAYILYRQHESNVVGAEERSRIEKVKGYVKYIFSSKTGNYRSRAAHQLLKCEDINKASEETLEILHLFDNLNTLSGRIEFCKSDKILKTLGNKRLFQLKAMLGIL